ncbi:NAD-dependent histone deacetylase sir2 [Terramyces sp. JEL0728]|nr:NAD-dependent histone deacetylase sir2 [Terramyces sp. JEL0728]
MQDPPAKRQKTQDHGPPIENQIHVQDEQQQGQGGEQEQRTDEEEEHIIELYDFSEMEKAILLDEAIVNGFWPWLRKYSRFGLHSLFKVFDKELEPEDHKKHPELLLPLLKEIFEIKAPRRTRLGHCNTFDDVVELIKKSKNIVVLTGAGVSVSCGIPDFRSKNGIYSRLSEFELSDPQEMFDLEYFKFRPETFYSFAKEIYPSNFKPSPSHMFIKKLEEQGKLLRNYTQNIDTLENIAGIKNVVQCHVPGSAIEKEIFSQTVPYCPKCKNQELGIMKPDIVFFGENLPNEFHSKFAEDKTKLDLLIVMDRIPRNVPQILINMESLNHMEQFDVHLLGYCDSITKALLSKLGWGKEIQYEIKQGDEPWKWLFEGASEAVHEETSEESSVGPDTEDEEEEHHEEEHNDIQESEDNTSHNIFEWQVKLKGPKETNWEDGIFKLCLYFDHNYNESPPQVFFLTVPFHPNIEIETGRPCIAFLSDIDWWRSDIQIVEMLIHIQNLLDEPELENAVNMDAVDMIEHSPKLYNQLVRDAVIATQRLEQGVEIFDECYEQLSEIHSEIESFTGSRRNSGLEPITKTVDLKSEKGSDKPFTRPKVINLSFDKYYKEWSETATSKEPLIPPQGKIRARKLLKFRTAHTKISNAQVKDLLDQNNELRYGNIKGIQPREKKTPRSKIERMQDLKTIYTLQDVPDESAVKIPQVQMIPTIEEEEENVDQERAKTGESMDWESEADKLVDWTEALPELPNDFMNLIPILNEKLTGDKINLPSSKLEKVIEQDPPFTFSLTGNNKISHAIVKEFTAQEGTIELGPFLMDQLKSDEIHIVQIQLPKCTFAKLKPSSNFNLVTDTRSLLEAHLRKNHKTLTIGETLKVPISNTKYCEFEILELKPSNACLLLDTDMEVDIEGHYSFDSFRWINNQMEIKNAEPDVYRIPFLNENVLVECNGPVFVSKLNESPSKDDHDWFGLDKIEITVDEPFYIAVECKDYTLKLTSYKDPQAVQSSSGTKQPVQPEGTVECENCGSFIPQDKLTLHQAFCFRNNVKCQKCAMVLQKSEFDKHIHCEVCNQLNTEYHYLLHETVECSCGLLLPIQNVAQHKKECVHGLIKCRYCHLVVESGGKSTLPKDLYLGTGLTVHESDCGSRTITCQRYVQTHMLIHTIQLKQLPKPKKCKNTNCVNILQYQNNLGLCSTCYQPFYSPRHDPTNQKLAQKIITAYHTQFTEGCSNMSCMNEKCGNRIGKIEPNESAVKSVELLKLCSIYSKDPQYWFCVGEKGDKKMGLAKGVVGWELEWVCLGLEKHEEYGALMKWLNVSAPKK